jgi:tetratricopeptide (TPR) repeat protein
MSNPFTCKSNDCSQSDIDHLNELIVNGKNHDALAIINNFDFKNISRAYVVHLAQICIRLQKPLLALKFLHKYVSPTEATPTSLGPTDDEVLTYSRCLYQLGASDDSLSMLAQIDANKNAEVYFIKACALMYAWRYDEAAAAFLKYSRSADLAEYRKAVVQLNICACKISQNNFDNIHTDLDKLIQLCEDKGYKLLTANALELYGQVYLFTGQTSQARDCLQRSIERLKESPNSIYSLYAKKWLAICNYQLGDTVNGLKELGEVAAEARKLKHWNTIRDCEAFMAGLTGNYTHLIEVINNSAFLGFKKRICHFFRLDSVSLTTSICTLRASEKSDEAFYCLDLADQSKSLTLSLYQKPLLAKLLWALSRDTYQPANMSFLFKNLYPTELFNPFTSPHRVIRLLKRLDSWFKNNSVPLKVAFHKSEFSLKSSTNVKLYFNQNASIDVLNVQSTRSEKLIAILKQKSCSAEKIARELNVSVATVLRLLGELKSTGCVLRLGSGRSTEYKYIAPNKRGVKVA